MYFNLDTATMETLQAELWRCEEAARMDDWNTPCGDLDQADDWRQAVKDEIGKRNRECPCHGDNPECDCQRPDGFGDETLPSYA